MRPSRPLGASCGRARAGRSGWRPLRHAAVIVRPEEPYVNPPKATDGSAKEDHLAVGGRVPAVRRGCNRAAIEPVMLGLDDHCGRIQEEFGMRRVLGIAVWIVVSAVVVMVPIEAVGVGRVPAGASAQGSPTSGWTPLRLHNGWTAAPFGTSAPAVRVISGIVYFKGAIATTRSNPVPFTLPKGFRPAAVVYIPVDMCNATTGRLLISPTGVVTVQAEKGAFSNAACFTSLDGASFAQ